MAENKRDPLRGPAKSPGRQAPDRSKFTSGKRHVSRTAGTNYGQVALERAVSNMREAEPRHMGLYKNAADMGSLLASGELYEESYVVHVLFDAAMLRHMNHREARNHIRRGILKGRAKPRYPTKTAALYTRNDVTVAVVTWWEAVEGHEWTGRASSTDLKVLAGFKALSLKIGKIRFAASYREISEEAGVSLSTICSTLDRGLGGFVLRVNKGNRALAHSSHWQLITKNVPLTNSSDLRYRQSSRVFVKRPLVLNPDHDDWTRWPNGWRLYILLSDEGLSVQEIAETTRLKVKTVRRILNRLRDRNLAQRVDGVWTVLPLSEENLPLEGGFVRNARESRHRDDRLLWANSRAVLIEKKWAAR